MPQPLHPAIVHFPIVLVLLLPLAALAAVVLVRRGHPIRASWLPVIGLSLALSLSAWAAVQTGQNDEERVEGVVTESAIETHEERAELFLPLTVGLLALAVTGLLGGRAGTALRVGTVVAAFGLAALGFGVGHSGGELVYRYGGAAAWSSDAGGVGGSGVTADAERGDGGRRARRRRWGRGARREPALAVLRLGQNDVER